MPLERHNHLNKHSNSRSLSSRTHSISVHLWIRIRCSKWVPLTSGILNWLPVMYNTNWYMWTQHYVLMWTRCSGGDCTAAVVPSAVPFQMTRCIWGDESISQYVGSRLCKFRRSNLKSQRDANVNLIMLFCNLSLLEGNLCTFLIYSPDCRCKRELAEQGKAGWGCVHGEESGWDKDERWIDFTRMRGEYISSHNPIQSNCYYCEGIFFKW